MPITLGAKAFRTVAATAALAAGVSLGAHPGLAAADRPPAVDPGLLPPGGPAAPPGKTEHPANSPCISTQSGGAGPTIPIAQRSLDLEHAWQFSKGAGQLVAVIDTGVAPHPRLPGLIPGGDYVANSGDGTEDCDAHGTLVAGLIAATQQEGQGFAGVAPEARIMTIRQTSALYQAEGAGRDKGPDDMPDGYGKISALASAVRRAADAGARVINISLVACPTREPDSPEMGMLGAAVRYAAVEKDAVIVTSAGNTDTCKASNPGLNPVRPNEDLWNHITSYVVPSWWDEYVLSVGAVDALGQSSKFTVPGPWMGVAAPGENIVSLDPRGPGLTTAKVTNQGQIMPYSGTSFAAPYVSGVAALIRSRFPEMNAHDVIQRIEATAHAPGEGWNPYIGYGAVDPVAALTAQVPKQLPPKQPHAAVDEQLAIPSPPPPPDHTARNVALIGTGIVGLLLLLGFLASFPLRRRFGVHDD
ncbi:type VII secretion-associated serine protease mycosin [Nocardia yamanashiensis]|uniref:type VII secretion-associated serine protease mycosin n=1 Tax=Nocardia yamanashiensis TaxID=209247 RepID=UPI001E5C3D62|nr:type VII secretion-associated serine protease mycosin [Nocardia yamanashiensis]UGT39619.1 type VII secretion-associated serine protease mycosin [Nocardia yamanashiensis]